MRARHTQGFTLIEMIVVIVVAGILAALGGVMMSGAFDAWFTGREIAAVEWQGRYGVERMLRELRQVRSATAADLTISPASEITFVTNDGASVRYWRNGATLMRNGQPLADGVTALNFTYGASDGKTTAGGVTQVYFITVNVTAAQGGTNLSWRDTVHPRSIAP